VAVHEKKQQEESGLLVHDSARTVAFTLYCGVYRPYFCPGVLLLRCAYAKIYRVVTAGMRGFIMLPFSLYFVTAVVTGFHMCVLLSFVVYGVPANPLELVSLLGSFCLLIAAYLSLYKPRAAGRLALLACLAMWCFYAPAIVNVVRAKFAKPAALSQMISPRPVRVQDNSFRIESARL
jgi:hypothetical protein